MPRVTIWNEYRTERERDDVRKVYPDGMHQPIADYLEARHLPTRIATFDDPEHGLSQDVLDQTDVLIWWGYTVHEEVEDEIVNRVHQRVLQGMGLIALHSTHYSKIFRRLMGTSCSLNWRDIGEKERLWVVAPGHPIAEGLGEYFEIPHVEMYGEPFDIPPPDELVFVSWFSGGDIFRSGCCYYRGRGKVFYFRPGDQVYPIYYQDEVLRVIYNAVCWAAPETIQRIPSYERLQPFEAIEDYWATNHADDR
ncbi:MAG: ThuA domain-containing protein [Anaerolineaceae bacterium]|nr:ThuA domain-containing protein [Anaerolineaceae bacterium]